MTRPVDPSKATNYLKKAEDSLSMARIALNEKAYDNAVMSAVHGAINALDALATKYLGKRASGVHTDSLLLVKGLLTAVEYREIDKQFTALVSMKNASEYEPVLMSKQDAERAIKSSELMKNCTSGIFVFTGDEETIDPKGNKILRPSDNVVYELGAASVQYGNKIVIFKEGVSFASDFSDIGYISFEKHELNTKAADLILELINLGFMQLTPA